MISDCLSCPELYNIQTLRFLSQIKRSRWQLSKKQEDWLLNLHEIYLEHIEDVKVGKKSKEQITSEREGRKENLPRKETTNLPDPSNDGSQV